MENKSFIEKVNSGMEELKDWVEELQNYGSIDYEDYSYFIDIINSLLYDSKQILKGENDDDK